jgi:glycosyltransferase involved in cell wall biosynthesis
MRVSFWVSSGTRPVGGVRTIFELANGLSRLGHGVNLIHFELAGHRIESSDDIAWFDMEPAVHQMVIRAGDGQTLPPADFLFPYHELLPADAGLPVNLVQGYRMMPPELEQAMYRAPCPKICVARWLIDIGRELGVPDHQLVYVPNGMDHETFTVVRPIDDRGPRVAMLYHTHLMKGTPFGLQALHLVKARVPELEVALFGTFEPPESLPPWVATVRSPSPRVLVDDIYNRSRIFVCPSIVEGFGLPSIEAMASGCALVTSANGGSDDFARHGETALVSEPKDVETMADHITSLLTDDERRIAIARRGREFVQRFDWELSSRKLAGFLASYGADPQRYRAGLAAG